MALPPVTPARIAAAEKRGLVNVDEAARACRKAGIPFYVACALLEKETRGANIWGRSDGPDACFSQVPFPVKKDAFEVFYWQVTARGFQSNGVGPCQITYAGKLVNGKRNGGLFKEMFELELKPWDAEDNMTFGFTKLNMYYKSAGGSWIGAGRVYNGSTAYGEDLNKKVTAWHTLLQGIK